MPLRRPAGRAELEVWRFSAEEEGSGGAGRAAQSGLDCAHARRGAWFGLEEGPLLRLSLPSFPLRVRSWNAFGIGRRAAGEE